MVSSLLACTSRLHNVLPRSNLKDLVPQYHPEHKSSGTQATPLHWTNVFCTTTYACGACTNVWFGIHLTTLNDGGVCSRGTHEVKTSTTSGHLCAHNISHLHKLPTVSRPHWATEIMLKEMATFTVELNTEVHTQTAVKTNFIHEEALPQKLMTLCSKVKN